MKTAEQYKKLTISEFTKAAEIYENDHAGLYEMCKETGDFDSILQAVIDNTKSIGKELDYNAPELDIRGQNVITRCRKFIQENAHHLRNDDEPDEYEPPELFAD